LQVALEALQVELETLDDQHEALYFAAAKS
jgi:hypothetical protein